jgi:hypothetical protein
LFPLTFPLAPATVPAVQTEQELRDEINQRDRALNEQRNQIERLTYAAGLGAAKGPSASLATRQHLDTIAKVTETGDAVAAQVSQAAANAEMAQKAATAAAVAAALVSEKLDRAKEESSKTLTEALVSQGVVLLTVVLGFIRSDLHERRNHRWALEAEKRRQEEMETVKQETDEKLATITALIDGTKKKSVDWKDL